MRCSALGVLALLMGVAPAFAADPSRSVSDFGAETIDNAIPVEDAEERGTPAIAAEAPRKPAPIQPHLDPDEEGDKLPPTLDGGPKVNDEVTAILNVKDVEIAALVKSFSKLTGRNFIVDSNVKGKVTMHLPTPVNLEEGMKILDSVLLLKGFATVPVGQNTWKVINAKDARQTTVPLIASTPKNPSDVLVTQLLRLKYVQASDMQQALQQFVSKDGYLNAFQGTNSLIVIDSAANIDRLAKLVRQLDVPALDQDITIIPIRYAEAKDVAEKIEQILGEKGEKGASQISSSRSSATPIALPTGIPQQSNAAHAVSATAASKRTLPLKIIPDERTNSVIVVADQETTLKVRAIAEQLDSKVDLSGGRFFVYRLKHADAEELAGVLSAVISGDSSGSDRSSSDRSSTSGSSLSRSSRSSGSSSGSRSRFGSGRSSERDSLSDRASARGSLGSPTVITAGGKDSQGKVNFEGEVSIAADPSTNSLIINSSRNDYLKVKEVVDLLDVKRKQVLVEATILEVTLRKNQGTGVEFQLTGAGDEGGVFAQTNYNNLTSLLTNPSTLSDLTLAAASTGTLTLPGNITIPSQALLISAVSQNTNVNVLSSPNILTLDNQEAEIVVGENVPFVTSTGTSDVNLNNTFNSIEREDVGITLRLTPQIGFGDFVNLKTFVEISSVVNGTRNNANGPTTNIRTTETAVEVKSGQMVVTGGLIADNVEDASRGVPYWEDIPVLGNLFRRDDTVQQRTNLLVFITPRIVSDQFDAREATVEKREHLKDIIERSDSHPDRAEILENDSIDRVFESLAEAKESPQPKPSTITPPKPPMTSEEAEAIRRTREAFERLSKTTPGLSDKRVAPSPPPSGFLDTPKIQGDIEPVGRATSRSEAQASPPSDDIIDITVTPKLPDTSTSEVPRRDLGAPQAGGGQKLYAVLRNIEDPRDTFGLVLPGESASKFFAVGGRYMHRTEGKEQRLVCLGKYTSMSDAAKIHGQLASASLWQELTPREILSLGRASWFQN